MIACACRYGLLRLRLVASVALFLSIAAAAQQTVKFDAATISGLPARRTESAI